MNAEVGQAVRITRGVAEGLAGIVIAVHKGLAWIDLMPNEPSGGMVMKSLADQEAAE